MSFSTILKSAETKIASVFGEVQADTAKVQASVSTVEAFFEKVMGEAETAAAVLALVDPAIGGPVLAEVSAVQAAYTTFKAVAADVAQHAPEVLTIGTSLLADLADLSTKLGPFFKNVANDAATAEAAFKTLFAATSANVAAVKAS